MVLFGVDQARADVKLTLNAKTREVSFVGKWKAGEYLNITVTGFSEASFDSLSITYAADEYTNTRGIDQFSTLLIDKTMVGSIQSYPLLPIMIQDKDKAVITISLFKGMEKIDEQVYSYRVNGGVKFDVSTGAFGTGLRSEAYALKPVSDSTNQIIQERNGKARIGVGILAHLHSRWNAPLNLGVSGGFELNADARIGYLAGVSVFFGYDRKFVLSGGVVASKKNVLSSVYTPGEIISREITSVPVVEVWAGGCFGGLSYNF